MAANYGFTVNQVGTANATYNIGSNGALMGVSNNSTMTILQILQATNAQATNGVLFSGDSAKRSAANALFSAINIAGS